MKNRQGELFPPGDFLRRLWGMLIVLAVLLLLGAMVLPVSAQVDGVILVQPPEITHFPQVDVAFKLPALTEDQVFDLQIAQLTAIENGKMVTVSSVSQERKGVHFTLAIIGGYDLAVRDVNGVSVYEGLSAELQDWAVSRDFDPYDAWSLITHEGATVRNQSSPEEWIAALEAYQPNFRTMMPDFSILETAFSLAQERVVPFGVEKALLLITLPPAPEQIGAINTLAAEAISAGVEVNIWMVGDAYFLTNDQGQSLVNLAARTGGQFFHYDGIDILPDPESYLDSLGSVYHLNYSSAIRQTGDYRLEILADLGDVRFSGESGLFHVEVAPPQPILVSPPAIITRNAKAETAGSLNAYSHGQQAINFLVTFPDGRPRDIVASRLYVNDILRDERLEPPFDELIWDLTGIIETGKYVIQVEVEDTLGLTARTNQMPVQVNLLQLELEKQLSSQQMGWILIALLLFGAMFLFLIWLFRRWWQSKNALRVRAFLSELFSQRDETNNSEAGQMQEILAYLIPAGVIDDGWRASVLPISQDQTVIGSDPDHATLLIKQKTVAGVHAQILYRENNFTVRHLNGNSGTWVNYKRVNHTPVEITTGDLLHFGNASFRFTIGEKQLTPKSEPYEPLL